MISKEEFETIDTVVRIYISKLKDKNSSEKLISCLSKLENDLDLLQALLNNITPKGITYSSIGVEVDFTINAIKYYPNQGYIGNVTKDQEVDLLLDLTKKLLNP